MSGHTNRLASFCLLRWTASFKFLFFPWICIRLLDAVIAKVRQQTLEISNYLAEFLLKN